MTDFPGALVGHPITITPYSDESLEGSGGKSTMPSIVSAASAVYPTGSVAILIPFAIAVPITVVKLFVENGTAVSGNIDMGIYDAAANLLVSAGSTAQAGTSAIQEFDITDTLLPAGAYYLAVSVDNTTATLFRVAGGGSSSKVLQAFGVRTMAAAFPLPNPAVPAACSVDYIPNIGLTTRTVI